MTVRPMVGLVRPSLQQIAWPTVIGPVVLAPALMALFRPGEFGEPSEFLIGVRLGAVLLAVGAAFLWDEPARAVTDAKPVRVGARRAVRLALYLPIAAVGWAATLLAARAIAATSPLLDSEGAPTSISIPNLALTLEAAGLVVVAVALAAIAARRVSVEAGLAASPLVLAFAAAIVALPPRFALVLLDAGDERWAMVNRRWWWVLGAAGALALFASRDPAGRLLRR